MGRKKLENKRIRVTVRLDRDVHEALRFMYLDNFSGRMKQNSVNDCINNLLRKEFHKVLTAMLELDNREQLNE